MQSWIECKKTPFTFHWSVDYFEECFSRASGNFDEPWSSPKLFLTTQCRKNLSTLYSTYAPCEFWPTGKMSVTRSFQLTKQKHSQKLELRETTTLERTSNQCFLALPASWWYSLKMRLQITLNQDATVWVFGQTMMLCRMTWLFWSFSKVAAVSSKKAALLHKWVLVKKCKRFFTLFRKHKWFWKLFTQMIQESYLANFEPEADLLCKPSQF